jgi:5-oxoprolinase (ATP-hydrolysing) subunit A
MLSISDLKRDPRENKEVYIDLNCDLAQSYGIYKNDRELNLVDFVSSINISCGLHAGDPLTMVNALKLAQEKNLSIGAHIGYPDIQGFGYRQMKLDDEEIQALVLYQIGALNALAKAYELQIDHVRPHGALYKQAAEDFNVSLSIAKAIANYNPWLIYVAAAGENLAKAGESANIKTAGELHLDKIYNIDGSIDFDTQDKVDTIYSLEQLNLMIEKSSVKNKEGGITKVDFCTIHLNTKHQNSIELARKAKDAIKNPIPVTVSIIKDTSWIK